MGYSSFTYLFSFLPAVLFLYFVFPKKAKWLVLLAASYVFFFMISKKLIVYLFLSTFAVHYGGIWIDKCNRDFKDKKVSAATLEEKQALKKVYSRKKKGILWFGIAFHLGLLLFLKYFNFFGSGINSVLDKFKAPFSVPTIHVLLPLGISFYTLQAISYIVDVYNGKIEADSNLARVALYMSFFPIIMEGPICRYNDTAYSLYEGKPLVFKNVSFGLQRIIWGLFKKLLVADRLNPFIKNVFEEHTAYGGITVIAAAILYTFQLYCDFSGCIDITIGTGEMFNVKIPENFRQPFFAKSASEFWRRWHITLGTFFKDYIFYPVSLLGWVKKLGKSLRKKCGKYLSKIVPAAIALFCVWIANGLWHGAGSNYIFYGMYYFVLILLGEMLEPVVEFVTGKLHINRKNVFYRILQTIKLLLIVFTGELFFRATSLSAGWSMFKSIFTDFTWTALIDKSLIRLGVSGRDFIVVFCAFIVILTVGIMHEKGIRIRETIAKKHIVLRWTIYYLAIIIVVVFGAYGAGYTPMDLIYAAF